MVYSNITSKARAYHERAVRVFKSCVSRENRVIRFDHRTRKLRCGVYAKLEFRFLAIIRGQFLQEESPETRTCSSTEGVEHEEALEARTVVCQPPQLVHDGVNELLANGVVPTGIFVNQEIRRLIKSEGLDNDSQLLAASSLPVISVSGWKSDLYGPVLTSSMTPGSRSMYRERGTCFPEPVSEKKVENPLSVDEGEPSIRRPSG